MEFFPILQIGFLNGWLFFILHVVLQMIHLKLCPKEVVKRLFDRSDWMRKQIIFTVSGKIFGLVNIILIFLTPLKIGAIEFIIGVILFSISQVLLHVAIYNFKRVPLGKPITTGLYKVSRNPQQLSLDIMFLGLCFMIGSWLSIIILMISVTCAHFGILGEEKRLKEQYGESYLEYKKKVPRYLIFF